MAVLITDGDQRSSLAAVRSLGRAGVEVCVAESHQPCLAGSSKYSSQRIVYPPLSQSAEQFAAALRPELESGRYDVLLPMTDISMKWVAACREHFPPGVRIPFPKLEQIELAANKQFVLETARRLGIPCPEEFQVDEANLDRVAQGLPYPVVIKPKFSREHREGKWLIGTVSFARNPAEFIAAFKKAHDAIPNPLVQEKLEGEGKGVFLLVWDGELKAAFCHRRLREKPPWGGVSVFCESVPLASELVEKSFELLKALCWQGVAMVEFKTDTRDGRAKLMEVNGRFWGSLQLAVDAGVDFPLLLYRCARGESFKPSMDYRVGIRSRWLLGDLDHLLIKLTHAGTPDGKNYTWGSRLRSAWDFLKPFESGRRSEVQRFGDMAPGWYEMKTYFKNHVGMNNKRSSRAHAG